MRGDILAVSHHLAARAEGKNRNAITMIQGVQTIQQREVRCLAVGEVSLIEAFAIHCRQKAPDALVIGRSCRAKPKLHRIGHPFRARGHGRSPATKSAAA